MSTHYHVGQNVPGYLPESDVDIATTKREAVSMLIQRKRDILDNDYGFHMTPPRVTLRCVGNARRDLWFEITDTTRIHDLGLVLWANVCNDSDCLEPCDCYPGCDLPRGQGH